jgi:hypothetical protein
MVLMDVIWVAAFNRYREIDEDMKKNVGLTNIIHAFALT